MDDPAPDAGTAAAVDASASAALPRRILVGVDERPESADALALADLLAGPAGAELLVASVRPFRSASLPPGDQARVLAEEEARLRGEVAAQLAGREFRTRVIAGGRPAAGLREIAAAEQADLIVIASTHRGPVGRVLPGSVGERVLDGAPCAVAIAPRGYAARDGVAAEGLRRIVVGCDGSRESLAALAIAGGLAAVAAATVTLVGVAEMRFDLAGFPAPADPAETARVERALGRARALLPPGLTVESRQVHGVAADVIAAAARGADLLAIGSRGNYGRMRRLFLGSVAARVASTASCPTLIVPAS
ncbi:MAG: universal stress protein [Solirubrobacterales bacterium]